MQKPLRMKGKTVEDATKAALEVLKAKQDEVEVKVLNEGKEGVLGLVGGKEAEVEVKLKVGIEKYAQDVLQGILDRMGFMALVENPTMEGDVIKLEIKGEDLGRIIGKDGHALDALQTLIITMASREKGERARVAVDAEGYRKKADARIVRKAKEIADIVTKNGEEREMPPLNARERRAVHMALKDNPRIETFSRGEGAARRLVIAPKKT